MKRFWGVLGLLWLCVLPLQAQTDTPLTCRTGEDGLRYHLTEGSYARGAKDLITALFHFNCAVEIDPADLYIRRLRGNVHFDVGNYDAAVSDYNYILERDPNNAFAYNNRGYVSFLNGWYELAVKDFSKAIEIDPAYARAYNNRGLAFKAVGDFRAAESDFKWAIDLNHEPPVWPRWNLARLYVDTNEPALALVVLEGIMTIEPEYADAYQLAGEQMQLLGNEREAQNYFERYLTLTKIANGDDLDEIKNFVIENQKRQVVIQYIPLLLIAFILTAVVVSLAMRWWQKRREAVA